MKEFLFISLAFSHPPKSNSLYPLLFNKSVQMAVGENEGQAVQLVAQALQLNEAGQAEVGRRRARMPQSLTVMAGCSQSTKRGRQSCTTACKS